MNRKFLILLIVLLTVFSLSGCSAGHFVPGQYVIEESRVDAISIDVRDRRIDVTVSEDDMIHIEYFTSEEETYGISVSDSGVLTMKSVYNKDWMDYIGSVKPSKGNRVISVRIPECVLSSLDISTTNETISVNDISVSDTMNLHSNGGNVSFSDISVGKEVDLKTKNGDIRGTIVDDYENFTINCDVKKGDSNIVDRKGGEKTLNISCNNGDVSINFI